MLLLALWLKIGIRSASGKNWINEIIIIIIIIIINNNNNNNNIIIIIRRTGFILRIQTK